MIQLSADDAAILGAAFTLIGAVVGGLIGALATVFAARLAAEKQQLYVESAKFRAGFVEELIKLRSGQEDVFRIIDDGVMAKHKKAKVLFEPWVPRCKYKIFCAAWSDYESSIKTSAPGSINNRRPECDSAIVKIENLLAHAKTRG